jgi:hypothetical protein
MPDASTYPVLPVLAAWGNFYVIIGSAAAALTGLQFVVIALISQTRMESGMGEIRAFGTPTIVHFGAVLLIAATITAPWPSLGGVDATIAIFGVAGTAYGVIVLYRARRQSGYQPVLEDWLWHCAFPLSSYLSFVFAAILLKFNLPLALFVLAAAEMFLLFIGIHNAWDTVTYIVIEKKNQP